jgi:uncharacterized protein (UPF0264 family)
MSAMSGPTWPRGLLVSVRSVEEVRAALTGGAAIIDVKEPSRGPLGRADGEVTASILSVVAGRAPVTLACGELADGPKQIGLHIRDVYRRLADGIAPPLVVKAGPSGLSVTDWADAFGRLSGELPAGVAAVAVAYADWEAARTARPEAILTAAAAAGTESLLVDTFDKTGPGLFGVASAAEIRAWIARAHDCGLRIAVAGRLSAPDVALAFELGADVVGVRSAACAGGRLGRIDSEIVAKLSDTVRPSPDAFR